MLNIDELKFDSQGLIPAVVVDSITKDVLTVAYMNKESLKISMEKGLTCFYSRSRGELWLKGETSGNYQHIVSITAELELYAPQVIELLHEINKTGCCEFLCEPYSHGLSSLASKEVFMEEVMRQNRKIKELFGKKPKVLRNSGLIYSDEIGEMASQMGFKGMLSEGAKHIIAWKSPHFVYNCAMASNLKLPPRPGSSPAACRVG